VRCEHCGCHIQEAKCGEYWCMDCHWYCSSFHDLVGKRTIGCFCRSHQTTIEPWDTCKEWMASE
jgi:hypothetical protein